MNISKRGYSQSTRGNAGAGSLTGGAINTAGAVDVRFAIIPDAFWVNGTGNLDLQLEDGQVVSFTITAASPLVPVRAQAIKATSNCGTVIALLAQ